MIEEFRGMGYLHLQIGSNITYSGPWGTIPELLFEKKGVMPALHQLLASSPKRPVESMDSLAC